MSITFLTYVNYAIDAFQENKYTMFIKGEKYYEL